MTDEGRVPERPQAECAWCGSSFGPKDEPYGIGASLDGEISAGQKGEFMIGVELEEENRVLYGLLPPPGSPARESGHDIWFMVCGESCANRINEQLEGGIEPASPGENN